MIQQVNVLAKHCQEITNQTMKMKQKELYKVEEELIHTETNMVIH
jgi:hypothetical protein